MSVLLRLRGRASAIRWRCICFIPDLVSLEIHLCTGDSANYTQRVRSIVSRKTDYVGFGWHAMRLVASMRCRSSSSKIILPKSRYRIESNSQQKPRVLPAYCQNPAYLLSQYLLFPNSHSSKNVVWTFCVPTVPFPNNFSIFFASSVSWNFL